MVRRSASSFPEMAGLQKLRSQLSGTFIAGSHSCSGELLEEAQVAVEEQPQIVDPVAQHGQALEPGTECEADVSLGIETEVLDHGGVHLSGARDLQPFAFQFHVDLGRWLREGKKRGPETDFEIVDFEKRAQEISVDAFKVGKPDGL